MRASAPAQTLPIQSLGWQGPCRVLSQIAPYANRNVFRAELIELIRKQDLRHFPLHSPGFPGSHQPTHS